MASESYDIPNIDEHSWVTSRELTYRMQMTAIKEAGKGVVAIAGSMPKGKQMMLRVTEEPPYNIKLYREIFNRVELFRSCILRMAEIILSPEKHIGPPLTLLRMQKAISDELQKNIEFVRQWKRHKRFDTWLYNALVCALWAGNSYTEIVYEQQQERRGPGRPSHPEGWKIHELRLLPPDELRPIRNSFGEVMGYVQYPFKGSYTWLSSKDAKAFVKHGAVIFEPHEIVHMKVNPNPGEAYGMSLAESVKDIMAIIIGMREDIGEIVKNYASPTVLYRVGTDLIPASAATVDEFQGNLQSQMQVSSNIVTSTAVQADVIDTAKAVMNMEGYFTMMMGVFFGAFGLPEIMLGQGNETTEATAKMQLEAVGNQVKVWHQLIKDVVEIPVFGYLSVKKKEVEITPGDLDKIPELHFGPVETTEDKRLRWENMFRFGGATREEWRLSYGMNPQPDGELVSTENVKFQKQLIDEQGKVQIKVDKAKPQPTAVGGTPKTGKPTQKKSDRDAEHGTKGASTTSKKK